jgi:hypothetical protein
MSTASCTKTSFLRWNSSISRFTRFSSTFHASTVPEAHFLDSSSFRRAAGSKSRTALPWDHWDWKVQKRSTRTTTPAVSCHHFSHFSCAFLRSARGLSAS